MKANRWLINGSGIIHVVGTYAPTEMYVGPFMIYGILAK